MTGGGAGADGSFAGELTLLTAGFGASTGAGFGGATGSDGFIAAGGAW